MTTTTVASNIVQAVRAATQQADAATALAGDQATATQAVATLAAYRANLEATVTAGQVSARGCRSYDREENCTYREFFWPVG